MIGKTGKSISPTTRFVVSANRARWSSVPEIRIVVLPVAGEPTVWDALSAGV